MNPLAVQQGFTTCHECYSQALHSYIDLLRKKPHAAGPWHGIGEGGGSAKLPSHGSALGLWEMWKVQPQAGPNTDCCLVWSQGLGGGPHNVLKQADSLKRGLYSVVTEAVCTSTGPFLVRQSAASREYPIFCCVDGISKDFKASSAMGRKLMRRPCWAGHHRVGSLLPFSWSLYMWATTGKCRASRIPDSPATESPLARLNHQNGWDWMKKKKSKEIQHWTNFTVQWTLSWQRCTTKKYDPICTGHFELRTCKRPPAWFNWSPAIRHVHIRPALKSALKIALSLNFQFEQNRA